MGDYVELHAHSCFSLLDGASQPEALVQRAAALGMPALALTDHDAVYGAARFARVAGVAGVWPLFGAELTLEDGAHLTVLVENATGWHSLCTLISLAQREAPKGQAALPKTALAAYHEGLLVLSGCRKGEIASALLRGDRARALKVATEYKGLLGADHFWIELQHHLLPDDPRLLRELVDLAGHLGLGYVTTNNVHYAERSAQALQDVLVCIRQGVTLDEAAHLCRPNSEYYLKPAQAMGPLFAAYPLALSNTLHLAERCIFDLRYGLQDLPVFPAPEGLSALAYLRQLCMEALPKRYPGGGKAVEARLDYELAVIHRAGLANYFLIVWDLVRFAREQGILCQGRGSAANSLVAYLLDISPVDPLAHDLVFERFLSDERQLAPDIDIDFQADCREEVIQYVYRRYGAAHTAMACTLVTFRARSAVRDVGKVLGLSADLVSAVARSFDVKSLDTRYPGKQDTLQRNNTQNDDDAYRLLLELCRQLEGLPRHLGIHNGGMVLTGPPLATRVPTEPAAMPERVIVQWDKESLEEVGLVKIDLLGLRMLSAIAEAVELIARHTGQRPARNQLPFDDPAVFALVARADTIGVFQVESRAQAQMLPRMRPSCFNDLVIAISLIRPGPIQGDMVHPYLRRRAGVEPVTYLHPLLENALAETLGVILFQEQVLKVARDLAGLTGGQGEVLRRALGSKYAGEWMAGLRAAFISGAQGKGVSLEVAEEIFAALQAFGSYSFAKSHAAAFAVLVYQSAWLKVYHPAAFYAALLNHQPMGFWSPAVLVNDARRRGIPVLPVHLARSQATCNLEGEGIRLDFNQVQGVGETATVHSSLQAPDRRSSGAVRVWRVGGAAAAVHRPQRRGL